MSSWKDSACLCFVALAVGGAGSPPPGATRAAEGLQFAVAPGTALDKRFETSFHMRVEDLAASDGPGAEGLPSKYPQGTEVSTHELLRLTDLYRACDPSGPLAIERTYLEWKLTDAVGEIPGPDGVGALLTACVVRFDRPPGRSWRREATTLSARARDEQPALEKLAPELDFAALLPGMEIQPGASWEIPLERVDSLATPGLDARRVLGLETTSLLAALGELPPGALVPSLHCTYLSDARIDERHLATIRLSLDIHASLAAPSAAREDLARQISGGASLTIGSFTHELELSAKGQLLWDLDEGHYHSFDLEVVFDLVRAWNAELGEPGSAAPISARERFHVEITTRASLE